MLPRALKKEVLLLLALKILILYLIWFFCFSQTSNISLNTQILSHHFGLTQGHAHVR